MACDHSQSNSLTHSQGKNQDEDTSGGNGADREHGGQWSHHPSWSSIHANKEEPSGTHSPRCNAGPKQAIGLTDRGPDGDPQQAPSTTTSGKSFSLFNHANRGMLHLQWSTRARVMHSPRGFFQGDELRGSLESPRIPRLQPRRTIGIQPREEFHTRLKLEESSGEPVQQGAKKSTCPEFQPRGRSLWEDQQAWGDTESIYANVHVQL